MSIDALLAEKYQRRANNCLHFAAKAWEHLTGDARLRQVQENDITGLRGIMRHYERVAGPTVEPSIVLMDDSFGAQHIGVCVNRRLLHLTDTGAQLAFFDTLVYSYTHMRFFR